MKWAQNEPAERYICRFLKISNSSRGNIRVKRYEIDWNDACETEKMLICLQSELEKEEYKNYFDVFLVFYSQNMT